MTSFVAQLAAWVFDAQAPVAIGLDPKLLVVRIDNLRRRIADRRACLVRAARRGDPAVPRPGDLPGDEVLAEAVLTEIELALLRGHKAGKNVHDAMVVLDQIATGDGDELAQALAKLKDLAIAGKL